MSTKRVILYGRVSLLELNVENQLVPLRHRCTILGYNVVGEFVDHSSGTREDRPYLRKALAAMQSENVDVLMVSSIDRLGRSVSHVIKIVDELRKLGKGVLILRENLDLSGSSPQGDLILHIFSALAQWEAALISERTKTSLAVAKLKGRKLGRPQKISKEVEQEVLDLYKRGTSIRAIARAMSEISRASIQNIIKKHKS